MRLQNLWLGTGGGYVIVFDDGSVRWNNIPNRLSRKLRASRFAPTHVSFTTNDNYHVVFADNTHDYSISDDDLYRDLSYEDTMLADDEAKPRVVFGSDPYSYFVFGGDDDGTTGDGRRKCFWKGIPVRLHNLLNGRQRSLPWIKDLALGPDDTYFVSFQSGGGWKASVFPELMETTNEAEEEGGGVEMVRMSPDNRYLYWLRDNEGTAHWRGYRKFRLDAKGVRWLDISNLRYTHDSIAPHFSDGRSIHELAEDLEHGITSVEDVEPIEAYRDQNGLWWCVSNRRLWAFKQAGIQKVPVIKIEPRRSLPVYDQGRWIKVRGGGGSDRRPSAQSSYSYEDTDSEDSDYY